MYNYEEEINKTLTEAGFDVAELTQRQKFIILEPMEAPENYYCDGEITAKEAELYWTRRLHQSGLSVSDIGKAIKLNN